MIQLVQDKDTLEITRNILRETVLGNSVMFLLASLGMNVISGSILSYGLSFVFGLSAFLVMFWMISVVTLYFRELQTKTGKVAIALMVIWGLVFETSLLITLTKLMHQYFY